MTLYISGKKLSFARKNLLIHLFYIFLKPLDEGKKIMAIITSPWQLFLIDKSVPDTP